MFCIRSKPKDAPDQVGLLAREFTRFLPRVTDWVCVKTKIRMNSSLSAVAAAC